MSAAELVRIAFLRTPNIAFVLLQLKFVTMEYRYLTQCLCKILLLLPWEEQNISQMAS